MSELLTVEETSSTHPMDVLECLMEQYEWAYDRPSDDEMVAEMFTKWSDVRLWFTWRPELNALLFSCGFGSKVPRGAYGKVAELLMRLNSHCLFGHFDLMEEESLISFRYTLLLADGHYPTHGQLEELIQSGTQECERMYPALQSVIWAGESVDQALKFILFDTAGEA